MNSCPILRLVSNHKE